MIRPSLLQRAKQGDSEAIAALMNLTLEPRGVTADVVRIQDCLHISFSSNRVLSKDALIGFTCKGLKNLAAKPIQKVKLYGMKLGEELPIWTEEVSLLEAEENIPTHLTSSSVDPPLGNLGPTRPLSGSLKAVTQLQQGLLGRVASLNTGAHNWLAATRPRKAVHPSLLQDLTIPVVPLKYGIILLVTLLAFLAGGVIALIANSRADRGFQQMITSKNTSETSADRETGRRQNQAKQYLTKMNQVQQTFYKQNGRFAKSLEELERSIPADFQASSSLSFQSSDYTYKLTYPDQTRSLLTATAKVDGLKSYTATVFSSKSTAQPHPLSAILCETEHPSAVPPPPPQVVNGTIQCPLTSSQVP